MQEGEIEQAVRRQEVEAEGMEVEGGGERNERAEAGGDAFVMEEAKEAVSVRVKQSNYSIIIYSIHTYDSRVCCIYG